MSGRQIEKNRGMKKYGLITSLDSHAKGKLSGDQFNVKWLIDLSYQNYCQINL